MAVPLKNSFSERSIGLVILVAMQASHAEPAQLVLDVMTTTGTHVEYSHSAVTATQFAPSISGRRIESVPADPEDADPLLPFIWLQVAVPVRHPEIQTEEY